ncbi:MAG: RseA family anti-sigma factor [Steroidobacteraceae bacterium]
MMHDELDSQLSAMFDDELPAAQCELLARRLSRDGELKARWGRYAMIGAAIRVEGGVLRLHGQLADRVGATIAAEPAPSTGGAKGGAAALASPVHRWWQPLAGAAVAAGVAATAIFLLRDGLGAAPIVAAANIAPGRTVLSAAAAVASPVASAAASDSFVVPPPLEPSSFAPPIELADFVVAHSQFSMPLLRRSALSALVAAETVADVTPAGAPGPAANGSAAAARGSAAAPTARMTHAAQSH